MASFTLRLGTLDLSNYVRVAQGDGLDPLDSSGFLDPQFNDSVIAEGAPLVYVTQGNREMAFPLYLKAASKDALGDLLQSINLEIKSTKPLRLEWKDQGATTSTFYDVTFARFDPDYNYRRAGQNWLGGILRVWSLPYGHTGSYRPLTSDATFGSAVRTIINASSILAAGATGPVDGDADAQLQVKIHHSTPSAWDGHQVIYANLPNVNWNPIINPSQFVRPAVGTINSVFSATIGLATGAPGSYGYNIKTPQSMMFLQNQKYGYKFEQDSVFGIALNPSHYQGNLRIFASVRSAERRGIQMQLLDPAGDPVSAPVTATGWRGYSLVDLGRITMPSYSAGATQVWTVKLSTDSMTEQQNPPSLRNAQQMHDPYSMSVGQIYVLPENSMQVYFDTPREPHRAVNFYGNRTTFGVGEANTLISSFADAYGNTWSATKASMPNDGFGEYPLAMGIASGWGNSILWANDKQINDLALEAEFDGYLFTGVASTYHQISVVQDGNIYSGWSGLTLGVNASGFNYLSCGFPNGAALSVASVGLTRPASASGVMMVRAKKQGPVWTAQVEWYAYASPTSGLSSYAVLGSVSGSHAWFQYPGDVHLLSQRATAADLGGVHNPIYSFRSHSLPSFALLASGYFSIDSGDFTAVYRDSADAYQRPLSGQRGAFQNLPVPSPAAHFVLSQPMDTPSDFVSVNTFIRERFTYVR